MARLLRDIQKTFKKVDRTLKKIKPVTNAEKILKVTGLENAIPAKYRPVISSGIGIGKKLGYASKKRRPGRPRKAGGSKTRKVGGSKTKRVRRRVVY